MAITITTDSATVSTTEYSMPGDTTAGVPIAHTDDTYLEATVFVAALAAGDEFRGRLYEKTNGQTATVLWECYVNFYTGGTAYLPPHLVGEGYDFTWIKIAGTDRVTHWSLRKTTADAAAPSAAVVADAVWDEAIAGHLGAGSTGEALDNASAGGDPAVIADAVWDEARAGHTTAGTFGEGVKVNIVNAGGIDASSIATDAIGSLELASTAVDKIVDGVLDEVLAPHNAIGSVGLWLSSLPSADADAVWDEAIAGHLGAGSTGEKLNSGGVSAGALADAVWDEATAGHVTAGTYGLGVPVSAASENSIAVSVAALINATITLSAPAIAAIWDYTIEGTNSAKDYMRGFASSLIWKMSGALARNPIFKAADGIKNRIVATITPDGRTAVTFDPED